MTAIKYEELSDNKLAKLALNPLTRAEALAEYDRRKAVALQLTQVAEAEARKVVDPVFPNATLEELRIIFRLMKPQAPNLKYIKGKNVPAAYTQLRDAIKIVLDSNEVNIYA